MMTSPSNAVEDASAKVAAPAGRLLSIDALRGFDMFWIMGGDSLAGAIANWLKLPENHLVRVQLEHVDWEGFRFYDLIFPLFLFLVGVVIPFSLAKVRERNELPAASYWRIARRVALLFFLGLVCNNLFKLEFESLRVAGVLQRIALCYGIASLVVLHTGVKGQAAAMVSILVGYWALMTFVAAPGHTAGDLSKAGSLAGYVDREFLPGTLNPNYYGEGDVAYGDNEGLLSTIPAVATTLLGALAGGLLRSTAGASTRLFVLTLGGIACIALGHLWGLSFPIIKNLWTSSFVLVAGGWSLLLLALFHAVIDVIGLRRWAFFFVVIGANAIAIFVVPRFVDFYKMSTFFLGGVAAHAGSDEAGRVILVAGSLAAKWLLLLYLYRNRIFLRV